MWQLLIYFLKDILIPSRFWQLWIKLLQISMHRFLCENWFWKQLDKYWHVHLLHYIVKLFLTLLEAVKLFSKVETFYSIVQNDYNFKKIIFASCVIP